ncbi:hypothetical protein Agabi119p4_2420 [Agaricus bisporus var. burnettii]|uniref:Uncharacterized protein n=1 Tax=Agaricus bisporus var. burnettii TaxID=192524 RepID=A0A8H7KJY7_AGABI|nr:hypothetical protein Agabi119p4_2420 [Agaricus bisporus var. burnettii]
MYPAPNISSSPPSHAPPLPPRSPLFNHIQPARITPYLAQLNQPAFILPCTRPESHTVSKRPHDKIKRTAPYPVHVHKGLSFIVPSGSPACSDGAYC